MGASRWVCVKELSRPWGIGIREDRMKNATRERRWTAFLSILLAEMQQHMENLQRTISELATGGSYSINRSR